jgi:hypothetical protein
MRVTFRLVRIGEVFNCNGNTYIKKSTRTALMLSAHLTFYFSQTDDCTI